MFSLSQLALRTTCDVQVIAGALAVADGTVCVLSEREARMTKGGLGHTEILCMLVSKLLNRCGKCVLARS